MPLDTKNIKRKNPINRNNLFMSPDQFNFQVGIGMEYVNNVLNQTIVLYEVDLEKTNIDDLYQETKFNNLNFKTPIELNVIYTLNEAELKTYDKNQIKGYYIKSGKLEFTIFEKELENNRVDIKRGDYIGLQVTPEHMEFFIVTDDGRMNFDNTHTLYGIMPYYRSIKCSIVNDVTETINM